MFLNSSQLFFRVPVCSHAAHSSWCLANIRLTKSHASNNIACLKPFHTSLYVNSVTSSNDSDEATPRNTVAISNESHQQNQSLDDQLESITRNILSGEIKESEEVATRSIKYNNRSGHSLYDDSQSQNLEHLDSSHSGHSNKGYTRGQYNSVPEQSQYNRLFDEEEETDRFEQRSFNQRQRYGYGRGSLRRNARNLMDDDDEDLDYGKYSQNSNSVESPIDISNLPPIKKNFFLPTPELLQQSRSDHLSYLREHSITVSGDVPPAIQQFSQYQFPQQVSRLLQQYDAPTPIQAQGWSIALSGKDFIGIGQVCFNYSMEDILCTIAG